MQSAKEVIYVGAMKTSLLLNQLMLSVISIGQNEPLKLELLPLSFSQQLRTVSRLASIRKDVPMIKQS